MLWLAVFGLDSVISSASSVVQRVLYQPEILLSGLKILRDQEVLNELPDSSVLWLRWNSHEVEAALQRHPLIGQARLQPCSWHAWSCFKIEIEERVPTSVIKSDRGAWIVGRDGAFLVPATRENFARLFPANERPLLIEGAWGTGARVDEISARVGTIQQALATIESRSGFGIESVNYRRGGELVVRFQKQSFSATFDITDNRAPSLADQVERMLAILATLKQRHAEIMSLDLALPKSAVVRFIS